MKSRFPFTSFPNGWFRVAYSDKLPPKKVIPLHYFGKDLVLFRTENGTPHIFDAHCPHLGAHLGQGGRVEGDTIRCPFHGWGFNQKGRCIDVPYAKKVPPNAHLRAWPVHEANGLIMMYYNAQEKSPSWTTPELPEWNPKEWTCFKRHSWKIRSHIQELLENGVDIAHLVFVHGAQNAKNILLEENGPIFIHHKLVKDSRSWIGKVGIEVETLLKMISYGLGWHTTNIYAKQAWFEFHFLAMSMLTPIDEEYTDFQILISTKKLFSKVATRALEMKMMTDAIKALEEDIPIWENKVYCSHPLLCDGDGPIMQYRHWARQFYPEFTHKD